jgi:SSS family solute:Na+ symporter
MGWPYVAFDFLLNFAVVLTWQSVTQRLLSARDSATGRKIFTGTSFFFVCRFVLPGIWGIAALATLAPDAFGGNTLHAMPKLLSTIVPAGLMGVLIAAMLAADMSTDSSYMLTWTSVIYNDIVAPFRRRPWPERRGILVNRAIVAGIGIFLLIYGLWYKIEGDLWTYLGVTGTIYLSSMSVLLISCCYWRRANDWGALGAIVAGAFFPIAFLILEQIGIAEELRPLIGDSAADHLKVQLPNYSGIAAYVLAATAMILGSLLKDAVRGKKEGGAMREAEV